MAKGFNPHPAVMLGATQDHLKLGQLFWCFNPHPAVMLGATANLLGKRQGNVFLSSPSGNAGCYEHSQQFHSGSSSFNPHPAVMLGATLGGLFILSKIGVSTSPSGNAGCY